MNRKKAVKFLTSPMFLQQLQKTKDLAIGKESGFYCLFDGNKITLNEPVVGGDNSIKTHCQGEEGLIYPENVGFYEGKDCQIAVCVHFHPGHGNEKQGIEKIFASLNDLCLFFSKMNENRNIVSGDSRWLNPINYIGCPDLDQILILQWKERLATKDIVPDHFEETAKKLFKKIFGKNLKYNHQFSLGAFPSFISQYPRRYFMFLDLLGIRYKLLSFPNLSDPESLKGFKFLIQQPQTNLLR